MSVYDKGGAPYSEVSTFANCGFSPIAIIFSLVSTCSAAISASCHPTFKTDAMMQDKLRWGSETQYNGSQVGHCSLMSAEAFNNGHGLPPASGWVYAGNKSE